MNQVSYVTDGLVKAAVGVLFVWIGYQLNTSALTADWPTIVKCTPFVATAIAAIQIIFTVIGWVASEKKRRNVLPYQLSKNFEIKQVIREID